MYVCMYVCIDIICALQRFPNQAWASCLVNLELKKQENTKNNNNNNNNNSNNEIVCLEYIIHDPTYIACFGFINAPIAKHSINLNMHLYHAQSFYVCVYSHKPAFFVFCVVLYLFFFVTFNFFCIFFCLYVIFKCVRETYVCMCVCVCVFVFCVCV